MQEHWRCRVLSLCCLVRIFSWLAGPTCQPVACLLPMAGSDVGQMCLDVLFSHFGVFLNPIRALWYHKPGSVQRDTTKVILEEMRLQNTEVG